MKFALPQNIPVRTDKLTDSGSLDVMSDMVLSSVDGKTRISSIADVVGLEEAICCKIFEKLHSQGLVVFEKERVVASRKQAAYQSQRIERAQKKTSELDKKKESQGDTNGLSDKIKKIQMDVERVYASLSDSNHYSLLNVDYTASRKEIRTAYFAMSKKFHPDKVYGGQNEALRKRMELIFRAATAAYEVLANSNTRQQYNDAHEDELAFFKMECQLNRAIAEKGKKPSAPKEPSTQKEPSAGRKPSAERKSPKVQSSVSKEEFVVQRPLIPKTPSATENNSVSSRNSVSAGSASAQRTRQSVVGSNRTRITESAPRSRPTSSNVPIQGRVSQPPIFNSNGDCKLSAAQVQMRREQWKKERVARAMGYASRMSSVPPISDKYRVGEKIKQAEIAIERDSFLEAKNLLESVLAQHSENEYAKRLLNQAKDGILSDSVRALLRQGRYEQRRGQHTISEECYREALKLDERSLEARYLLANLYLEKRVNIAYAIKLCKDIIAVGKGKARHFKLMGQLLLLSSEKQRAAEAFNRAIALEPENEDLKKLLKSCQK